ncbi:MAG: hypothetical protein AB7Q17_07855 [Phycisphaerae bacterium]
MKRALSAFLCCLGLTAQPAPADGVIQIPVSVKIMADPDTGEGPPGVTSFLIANTIDDVNARMTEYSRGYRLVLVDPVTLVGAQFEAERPNPGYYYLQSITGLSRLEMESDAIANPELWAWNSGAINIYIKGSGSIRGLLCRHPESQILVIDDFHAGSDSAYVHMLGHFFGLCNTHGCGCNCDECDDPESDGIADTLPDRPSWNRENLAFLNFGTDYAHLTPAQQALVDNTLNNMMSYRIGGLTCNLTSAFTDYLTEGQLDRWADVASTTRLSACDGRTFFVQTGTGGFHTGRSSDPFRRIDEGVAAATGGGDILLIRGGTYAETPIISSPVTLRAPRGQVVRIGG